MKLVPKFLALESVELLDDNFYMVYNRLKIFLMDFNNEMIQGFDIKDKNEYIRDKYSQLWDYIDIIQKTDSIKKQNSFSNRRRKG